MIGELLGGVAAVEKAAQEYLDLLVEISPETATSLGIHTRDELADLAVDELTEMSGVDEEQAKALIMKAREHWFTT